MVFLDKNNCPVQIGDEVFIEWPTFTVFVLKDILNHPLCVEAVLIDSNNKIFLIPLQDVQKLR